MFAGEGVQISSISNKKLYTISFFVFLGAVTRATAHLIPSTYISHLGYASICVFISAIIVEVSIYKLMSSK